MDAAKKGPSAARRMDTKKMAILAMMAALAYVVMLVGRVPIVLWLKYDPKDVVIAIAAFIYGPMAGVGISIVDSLIEMLTASDTGIWGFIMNVLSTCSLVVPAALIYHRHHTIKGAVLGLIVGSVLCVAAMLLWNWLVTPFYMGQPLEAVEELLIPYFLPFNAFKASVNSTLTVLLYKPVVTALRKAKLVPESEHAAPPVAGKKRLGVTLVSLFVLVTFVLLALVLADKI